MKSKYTLSLLSLAVIFASCTTAYKSGQTPDDVYYSPARPQAEYVLQENNEYKMYRYDEGSYRDDRYLRMKVSDPRYSLLYNDYYSYNPYYYHYYNNNLIYNTPWTPVSYWSYYYNPYSYPVVRTNSAPVHYNKPRVFDLSVYNPQPVNNIYSKGNAVRMSNSKNDYYQPSYNRGNNTNNYRNSGTNAGSFLRNSFSGGSNNSGNSRSYSPSAGAAGRSSSGSSSGGGSRGSTNAPVRKF